MPFNKFYSRAGLPCWLSSKQSSFQCRRHEFNPWVRKFPFRKKWKPTPAFLPGKSHRQRSLVGYSPWGHKESDTTEQLSTAQLMNVSDKLVVFCGSEPDLCCIFLIFLFCF